MRNASRIVVYPKRISYMVCGKLYSVFAIITLLAIIGCNDSGKSKSPATHTAKAIPVWDINKYTGSWGTMLDDFTPTLAGYYAVYKEHLYDKRGPEYALYRMVTFENYHYGDGERLGPFEQRYRDRHCLPFSRDDKNGRVVDSQVYYLNPPPGTLKPDDEPVVLLIRSFDATDKPNAVVKRLLLKRNEALFIGSDFKWYWGVMPKSKVAKAQDLLGKKVKDVLALCSQSKTHNMIDIQRESFIYHWQETAKKDATLCR